MSLEFLTVQNAVAFEKSKIPVVATELWRQFILEHCHSEKTRIVALFGERKNKDLVRCTAVLGNDSKGILHVGATDFAGPNPKYPSLTQRLFEAHLFERELFEEFGLLPEGHPELKPVRKQEGVSFYQVEGGQVHEVAVGPVHAGIIEPGHFRFQCHGEKVLNLEIQLGYQHRGIEALILQSDFSGQMTLAESIAGDTTIGHALAYAHAIEGLSERPITPQRAQALRAIALELERLANHVGDLGALAGDVGFLPGLNYFGRLRGEFLNLLLDLTGNRYGRSFITVGGVLSDMTPDLQTDFQKRLSSALTDLKDLVELFFNASSVLSRLEQTGILKSDMAKELGAVGCTARASNLLRDVRQHYPTGIYRIRKIEPVRMTTGDVYARARIRSLESKRSLQFIQELLETLPQGKTASPCGALKKEAMVVSLIEGWRGEIVHIVSTSADDKIDRYKIVDPSFHNWKALEVAMRNGQISDFPLCNKSFNLSYAGHDL